MLSSHPCLPHPVRNGAEPSVPSWPRSTTASLLPLLLVGVTDPQAAIASLALSLVEGVGRSWEAAAALSKPGEAVVPASPPQAMEGVEAEATASSERSAEAAAASCQLGPPYAGRPAAGARRMAIDLLPLLLPPLLHDVGEWTVGQRACAARQVAGLPFPYLFPAPFNLLYL